MEKIKPIIDRIRNWVESDKGKDILVAIIVILVGLGSFQLGRLSKGNQSSGIQIEYPGGNEDQQANVLSSIIPLKKASAAQNSTGKNFFASSRGSKYYSLGCSAGKTIKQENRIYFATGEEAEKEGYALSDSCR